MIEAQVSVGMRTILTELYNFDTPDTHCLVFSVQLVKLDLSKHSKMVYVQHCAKVLGQCRKMLNLSLKMQTE